MHGKTFRIAMLSAFVSLAAFTVQEADARGGGAAAAAAAVAAAAAESAAAVVAAAE